MRKMEKDWVQDVEDRAYKALDNNMIVGISYLTKDLVTLSYEADELDDTLKHIMRNDELVKILYDTEKDNADNIKKLINQRVDEYLTVAGKISGYKYLYTQVVKCEIDGVNNYSNTLLSNSIEAIARYKVLFNASKEDIDFLINHIIEKIKKGEM